ncbi:GAF and ANTAR domain-containing protein [Nocardioides marmoraquaticus]
MPENYPPEMQQTFRGLAEVVYAGESHEAVHQHVVEAAVQLVDGCDHASLMLRRGHRVHTAAASDATAKACDEIEQEVDAGPCLDALDDDKPDEHLCGDLGSGTCDWPELAERLQGELGIRGSAGFRLRHDGHKVGALNLFSDTPGALTQRSLDQASMLVSFASVALVALDRGDEARTLREGLTSNREIGKAIGLLMASHGVDADEAFRLLSRVSQEMNLKVVEVAAQFIRKHGTAAG